METTKPKAVTTPSADAHVARRMAEFSPKPAAVVDHFTGKKLCHRMFIPVDYFTPSKLDPKSADLITQVANINCYGVACALFNNEAKECLDVTQAKGTAKLAATLEAIDGHNRLSESQGG